MKSIRKQKRVDLTGEQIRELMKNWHELVTEGLVEKVGNDAFHITPLGRRTCQIMEELEEEAILRFVGGAGRPVTTEEIQALMDEKGDAWLAQALTEAKKFHPGEHSSRQEQA